jgi:hypothetical protein
MDLASLSPSSFGPRFGRQTANPLPDPCHSGSLQAYDHYHLADPPERAGAILACTMKEIKHKALMRCRPQHPALFAILSLFVIHSDSAAVECVELLHKLKNPASTCLGVAIYVIHGILIIEIPSHSNKDHDFSAISQACGCRARNARRRYSYTAYTDPEANTRATIFTDLPYTTPAARLPCVDSPHATEIAAGLMLPIGWFCL